MATVVTRNVGPLAQLKRKMAKRGTGGNNSGTWITWVKADPGQLTVRFLTELTGFEYYQECWPIGRGRPFPYAEGMREGVDFKEAKDMYLANALDVDNDKVIALQIKPSVLSSLMLKHERYDTIMDRDYTIIRYGEGLGTEYGLENEGASKRNLSKYDLLDLRAVIQGAYEDVFGGSEDDDDDEDEQPRRRPLKKAAAKKLTPRKRVHRGRPAEDEYDEDEEDEEEEGFGYTEEEMREMDWSDLREYARTQGVNPQGIKVRSQLIKKIQAKH